MSWKDKILDASFKGIPFLVEDIETKSGKRIASFEYPKLNTPATEDMGRKQRSYSVNGFVLGDDFKEKAEALLSACESELAGALIHPFHGEIIVHCEEVGLRYIMSQNGRMALFTMSFIEAGQELYPSAALDKKAELEASKESAVNAAKENFTKKYSVTGKGQILVDSASKQLSKWTSQMDSSISGARGESSAIASVGYSIGSMGTTSSDTIKSPALLASNFSGSISGLKNAFISTSSGSGIKDALGAYKKLYKKDNSNDYISKPLTSTRKQELKNQKAIDELGKSIATVEAITIASEIEYESLDEAESTREEILVQIEKMANETDSDDFYRELTKIKSLFIELVPSENQTLPMLKKIKPEFGENILTLCFRIYGNIENADAIARRNKISKFLVIPSDMLVEVPIE